MNAEALAWLDRNTWQRPNWTLEELISAKGERTVSVVLPALNEEATVGNVVSTVKPLVGSLVDELIVMDSGSTDRTLEVAARMGATVFERADVVQDLEPMPGKGEVLWRSLAATTGDVLVFVDSDLIDPDPGMVPGLLGPIFSRPEINLVKAFYRRPLRSGEPDAAHGGGRVTELLARPLLGALWPALAGVVQPLGGEYAASRKFLESVPFPVGYGVEIGLLLDAYATYGLAGIGQVNMGVRKHRNRSLADLGVMSRQILEPILDRAGVSARSDSYTQFVQVAEEWLPNTMDVSVAVRPPMREVTV